MTPLNTDARQGSIYRNVIIAGAPRCGTTSLFDYLSSHPDVVASRTKQTGFFLDAGYEGVSSRPLKSVHSEPDAYDSLFPEKYEGQVALEATPDYLYSAGTAGEIAKAFPDRVALIFILRNPIDQFNSYVNHGLATGQLPESTNLSDILALPVNQWDVDSANLLLAADYASHLKRFTDHFDVDDIRIVFSETLKDAPEAVMKSLCEFIGLDDSHFGTYEFEVKNQARATRYPLLLQAYRRLRRAALLVADRYVLLRKPVGRVGAIVSRLYHKFNSRSKENSALVQSNRAMLAAHFASSVDALENMMGVKTPWQDFAESTASESESTTE